MSDKNSKQVRGQLRIIAKEILPEVISNETYKELQKLVTVRLDNIEKMVREALEGMSNRQKDAQDFLVRQVSSLTAPQVELPKETPPSDQL